MHYINKCLTFCLLMFFGFSRSADAQYLNTRITDQYINYNKLIIAKNYDKALDYTTDGIFKIIPREQMVMLIKQLFENPELVIKPTLPNVSDIGPVRRIGGQNYVKFISNNTMQMKFLEDDDDKNRKEADRKLAASILKAGLIKTFGEGNVSYDETTDFFTIKSKKNVIACADDQLKDWKFAVVENEQTKKILATFIPVELLDQ